MAVNLVYADGESGVWSNVTPTNVEGGGSPASGKAALVSQKPGVCLNNAGEGNNDAGACDLAIQNTFSLPVTAVGAIAYGDEIYYTTATNILTDASAGGVLFGYARAALGIGSGDIPVSVGK